MAQCKVAAKDFIINAFSPQVAAVCSNNAEATCQKNNLSFIELLQPFCRINTEGHIKDPQGTNIVIRSIQISIKDVNYSPPEPSIARKLLNESVNLVNTESTTCVQVENLNLDIPASVPWFEAWRETFLNVQFPSDHEFTKHFLACMIVVSTQDMNPLEKIQQIGTQLNLSSNGKLPKWFNNNVLRYYILLHDDIEDDKKKAEDIFGEMKNIYGSNNCFFLKMNSRPVSNLQDNSHLPDPWSQFIGKQSDFLNNTDQGSSPQTPTDTTGVSSMPNAVSTESEKSSSSTPITPIAPKHFLASPQKSETITVESENPDIPIESVQSLNIASLEVGQEAVAAAIATVHPLSPESELIKTFNNMEISKTNTTNINLPVNINVWADSPTHVIPQHGARLSTDDLERLKLMMSDFYLKSFLPYVEKQIALLNDLISNKKGVSRSLFSATKRWFGTNKPGVPGSVPTTAVIYTAESPELQLRRLGDICFMVRHYTLAYQAYHNAKRDFAADQAWVYYAGALEMAALSAFMMDEMIKKTIEYMDDAITTYLNVCKMPQFATRATLLSVECLKNRSLYGEAAKQLIRMTSEDSDLRSALLLEQAAYCFISPKMIRKYAFHAVLAGHRFSKAGQKKHSLRCYRQAYQVYNNKGWSLAEDHIHFTIGRQAVSLKQVEEAIVVFEKLLSASSKQPALQQLAFLKEYLTIQNIIIKESKLLKELPLLPMPIFEDNEIQVLIGPFIKPGSNIELANQMLTLSQDVTDPKWSKLEEIVLSKAQGTPPMIFKPAVMIHTNITNNTTKPNAFLYEPIYLCLTLTNPLLIPLPLSNLKLIWSFKDKDNNIITNENDIEKDDLVNTLQVDSLIIQPVSKETLVLSLVPNQIGELNIIGLSYVLSNPPQTPIIQQSSATPFISVTGKHLFSIKGQKLKNVKEKSGTSMYSNDLRLNINVVDKAPFLELTFSNISSEMLSGELQQINISLKNIGNVPLMNIHLGTTDPKLFAIKNYEEEYKKSGKKNDGLVTKISGKNDILNVGESFELSLWVCSPHEKGKHTLDLLFYYENATNGIKHLPKYRTSRHSWNLNILDSIESQVIAQRSASSKENQSIINLIINVKNLNQMLDSYLNEIELVEISCQSKLWKLKELKKNSFIEKRVLKYQEMLHFILKLSRKEDNNEEFSNCILNKEFTETLSKNIPCKSFLNKRYLIPLNDNYNKNEIQQQSVIKNNSIISSVNIDSTLILKWKAIINENGAIIRNAIGLHFIDLTNLIKQKLHTPEKNAIGPNEYSGNLIIFGPNVNLSDVQAQNKKELDFKLECQKNIIWYCLKYSKSFKHNFLKNRICIVPLKLNLHNNSELNIDIKIDTIGTSSQTNLPSIRSQLYSSQASTNFRYAGQSSFNIKMKPHDRLELNLKAIIPTSGSYDLSSRLEILAKFDGENDYALQKWKMENVCIVHNEKL